MILIAHRGNIDGPNPNKENSQDYITEALNEGFHVEIDVWISDGLIFLGHDEPQYQTTLDFLKHNDRIICHAKTVDTLQFLITNELHCFFHDRDDATLTSKNKIWLYPGMTPCTLGILVMPEWSLFKYNNETWLEFVVKSSGKCYGVCSDNVRMIQKSLHNHIY
jgi:hypothetical protein